MDKEYSGDNWTELMEGEYFSYTLSIESQFLPFPNQFQKTAGIYILRIGHLRLIFFSFWKERRILRGREDKKKKKLYCQTQIENW